jgi:CubicO group peptidase (beta-lactamase class C family)
MINSFFRGFLLLLALNTSVQTLYSQRGIPVSPFPTISAEEAGFSAERLDRLPALFRRYAEEERLSGGVMLILRDGHQVVYESFGYLDIEAGIPMPHNAIFRIASQTKAIIATAVMMLQEQGLLLIHDPIGKYLPEYQETTVAVPDNQGGYNIVPASRRITIRDLLMHTAGISYGYGIAANEWRDAGIQGWYLNDRDEPIRETVRKIASLPFDAHPGERYVYGYANDILGALIEVVSGIPLDQFLQQNIFNPLGMIDTHFFLPSSKHDRLAVVYSAAQGGVPGLVRAPDPGRNIGQGHYTQGPQKLFSGGAGLVSTAADYARFLQMKLNGGSLNGHQLLSPTTVELMTTDHLEGVTFRPGLGIGLGYDVVINLGQRGVPGALGDFGWGGAYHSTYWVSPRDNLVVVFFTQLTPSVGSDAQGKLRTMIYQAIMD